MSQRYNPYLLRPLKRLDAGELLEVLSRAALRPAKASARELSKE
ncbi:hypothetical protein [Pyrodictium occultum]|nr:hypothetical protein [Pyrodictium occultum]